MKRILTFSLCIIMLLSCIVIPTFAEEATPEQAKSSESPSYNKDELLNLITSDYSDAAAYPFAIFTTEDGGASYSFKTACKYLQKNSNEATANAVYSYIRANFKALTGSAVIVIMRRDYGTKFGDTSDVIFKNVNQWDFTSFVLDLNNKTFDLNTAHLIQYRSNTTRYFSTDNMPMTVTVKNGNVILSASESLLSMTWPSSEPTGSQQHLPFSANYTFDDITVISDEAETKLVSINYLDDFKNVATYNQLELNYNVLFKNCTAKTSDEAVSSCVLADRSNDSFNNFSLSITCEHNDTNNDRACDLCGYEYPVLLSGYSTTLGETLGINFYAQLPASVKAAEVTVAGGEPTVFTVSEMTKLTEGDYAGHYKFSSSVSSVNVREDITIRFLDGDGIAVAIQTTNGTETNESYTTSVFEYANSILNDATYGAAAEALLNYAAYAEAYFGETYAGDRAYNATSLAEVTALEKSAVTGTVSASAGKTILGKVQLDLDNQTTIRIYIEGEAIDEIGGTDAAQVTKCSGYIEICGIDAKNLNKAYTFTVNGVSVAISATGVAQYVVNTSTNQDAVNLMKALYLFSEAVKAL